MASEEHVDYQDITIETIDQALVDWFKFVVVPKVRTPTDEQSEVPVLFASGERWATNRDKRVLRDKNGVLILPLISVRRTHIDRARGVPTALTLGVETKTMVIKRRIDPKTNVLQNAIASRSLGRQKADNRVVHEITTIPFPDWFTTGYEVVIQTQYMTQMNEILEQVFHSLDLQNSFVMPVRDSEFQSDPKDVAFEERSVLPDFYFVGFMDTDMSDSGNLEEFTDTERVVRYSYNVFIPSYLQLDPDGKRPAIQKKYTSYKFGFCDERVTFVDDPYDLELVFDIKKQP